MTEATTDATTEVEAEAEPTADSALGVDTREEPEERWVRSPVDVANIVVGFIVVVAVVLTSVLLQEATEGLSEDVVRLFDSVPTSIDQLILGVVQLAFIASPLGLAGWLIWRRNWRCLGVLTLAGLAGAAVGAIVFSSIDDVIPADAVQSIRQTSFVTGAAFPSPTAMAAVAAVVSAAAPWLSRRHRRAGWIALAVLGVARIVTTTTVPTTVAGMFATGFMAGSATLLVTGSPLRRPKTAEVLGAVRKVGVAIADLVSIDLGAHHSSLFRGTRPDGTAVFVKAIDADTRTSQLLYRTYQVIRVKGLEDEHPNRSAIRSVERDALGAVFARRAGAHPPDVLAVSETMDKATILVTEWVDGRRLAECGADEISDELLDDLWSQIGAMGDARLAHRWLDDHHVLVTPDDRAVIIDYRWSILGANDAAVGADVAGMICSLALIVGAERAVASARRNLDDAALARALPVMQPLALTPETRKRLSRDKGLIDDVRGRVQHSVDAPEVELAALARVNAWTLLTWVGVFVLASFVLAVVSNIDEIIDALQTADWADLPWIVVCVVVSYLSGAVLLMGSATVRLPFLLTSWVMLAQSFLNRFTPANAGGMAMRVRFLQRNGEGIGQAASTIGITSVANGVMSTVLIVVFVLWAGSVDEVDFSLPDINLVALVIVAIGVAAGVVFFTAWGRRVVLPWIKQALETVWDQVAGISTSPGRLTAVLSGATMQKFVMIVAFYITLDAFGVDMAFVQAGSLYLIATTVGAAVPTPGGVGGVEAALTAMLTAAGVDSALAFSIVLIFRLITYWLPVPFGWIALHDVQRRDIV